MNFTVEQFTATNQANVDALHSFSNQAYAGFEKLVELNMAASKALLGDSFKHTQAVLDVKEPQEFMDLQAGLVQPLTEKSVAYGRHVYAIATDVNADFTKAFEAKIADAQSVFAKLVENVTKNAPAGTEPAVEAFKKALTTGQNAIESAQTTAKKAIEMAETNFAAATDHAVSAAASAAKKA